MSKKRKQEKMIRTDAAKMARMLVRLEKEERQFRGGRRSERANKGHGARPVRFALSLLNRHLDGEIHRYKGRERVYHNKNFSENGPV